MDRNPRDTTSLDAVIDAAHRAESRRGWSFWTAVAVLSGVAIWVGTFEALPDWLQITLVIFGAVGLLLFLCFLSTKPFGYGYYNGPSWWGSWWL
jgi:hypothetical protein